MLVKQVNNTVLCEEGEYEYHGELARVRICSEDSS